MRQRPRSKIRFRGSVLASRRRAPSLEGLEDRLLLTQLQYGLFDTGVDGSGNVLAGGASDPHYTLVQTQQGTAGMNAVVASTLAGGWAANGATDAWIAPVANEGSSSTSPAGTYEYETTFNVANANGGNGQITGSSTADDAITAAYINGVSVGYSQTNAAAGFINFRIDGNIVAGANTLDFVVSNSGSSPSSTGFHAKGLTLNFPPSIASDHGSVTVVSGQTATNTGTFNEPDPNDTVTLTASRGTVSQSSSHSGTFTYTEANPTTSGAVTITATNTEGAAVTTTFNLYVNPDPPPTLTAGGTTNTARSGGAAVAVDPGIILDDTYGPNLTSASISIGTNFTASEDQLLFANQNGISGSYGTSTGILTLSGSATPAQYQAALRSVQYEDTNGSSMNVSPRTINFSIAPGTFNPANGHFYQFIRNPGITWTAAKAAADASSIYGLQGYLATLTSAAENTFAFSKTQSTGWIGASDAANPGVWAWADGPETGLQFWQGIRNGSPYGGQYNDWNTGEPNDSQNVEFYAQYLQSGLWNDLANTSTVNGYLIEYGGEPGDPTLQLTSNATVNVATFTATPTVSSPAGPTSVNAANYTIQGTAAAGSLVTVYDDVNANGSLDPGESVVGTEQLAAGQTSYSLSVPLTQSSTNDFLVTATDSPANESTPAVVPTVTADSTPPALPAVTSPASPVSIAAPSIAITGTAEAGSLVRIYSGESVVGTEQLAAGQTSYSIAAPLAQNVANNFLVTAADAAGNESSPAAVPTVTEDSIAPVAPVVTAPSAPGSVNTSTTTVSGTAEAGSLVDIYNDGNGNGSIDEGEAVVGFLQLAPGQTSYSITVPLAPNAANNFLATATDAAGNQSAPVAMPTITEDSLAPVAPVVTAPSVPSSVNAAIAIITGTAEAGSLVRIYSGETVVGTEQLAAGQTSYSIAVPLAPNAVDDFLATATDAAGNQSAPVAVPTITEDSLAPVAPVVTAPSVPSSVNAAIAIITGTAEAGSLVRIYSGETVVATEQLAPGQTSYSIAATLIQNAANNFLVTSTDAAGNESSPAAVPTVTEDSIAPVVPTVTTPSTPSTVNTAFSIITGTAQAGSLVRLYSGATVIATDQLAPGQTSYSIAAPLTPNAANNFLITSVDDAGNQSSPAVVPTITQDSTAPAIPTVSTPSAPLTLKGTTEAITGTAEAGSLVRIYSGTTVVGTEQLAPDQTSYSIAATLTPNAANSLLVTSTDSAGNQSAPAVVPTVTEDSLAPVAPVVTSPSAPGSVNTPIAIITGTAEAGSLIRLYSGEAVVATEQLAPGQTSYSIAAPLAPAAASNFLVTSTDAVGNQSSPAVVPTITQDSTAPAIPTVSTPSAPLTLKGTTEAVTGTAEAGSLVRIYSGTTVVGTEQLAPDQTSYSIAATLTPNAANSLLVTSTDSAGNQSAPVVVPTVTEDSTPPPAPTGGSPASSTTLSASTVTLTGTAAAGSLVQVYGDANGNGSIDDGEVVVGFLQLAPDQTSYSITVPLAPAAANNFLVTATDAVGNQSSPVAVPTITQDSTAPVAPVVAAPSAPGSVNTSTTTISGTAEAGSLVDIYNDANGNGIIDAGDAVVGTEQLSPGETSYSITVPLALNAANNFLATATDAAGNVSSPVALPTVTEDSTPPPAPTGTLPGLASTVNATTYTLTGTAQAGSLVQVFGDANGDGSIDDGEVVVGFLQLAPDQTSYSITVPLAANALNNFLVTSTDAAGNRSAPVVVPTITEDSTPPPAPTGTLPGPASAVNATTYTLTGTAQAGSLVQVFGDANGDGTIDDGEVVVGFLQLAADQTSYSITVPLAANALNNFLVTSTDGAGNRSAPVVVPTISTASMIQGTVYQDLNADGSFEAGEPALAGRVVFLDLKNDGVLDAGDPTATTDADGHFSFSGYAAGSAPVLEETSQDSYAMIVVDQTTTDAAGSLNIGAVPFSPIAPVPVIPSPFTGISGTDPNAIYVQSLYHAVLGRVGGDSEVAGWVAGFTQGMTQQQVAQQFYNSPEHRQDQVAAYYEEFLHRAPDPGSAFWVNELMTGVSEQKVAEGILDSVEYQSAHQDPALFAHDLYIDVLGRQGESTGIASWQSALTSGVSRGTIVAEVVESTEAIDQIVEGFYASYLHRQPEQGTSDIWKTMLAAGDSASDVAVGILTSEEFVQASKQA